jgi:hypothetical protein
VIQLREAAAYFVLFFVAAMACAIAIKLLTGGINMQGLLYGRTARGKLYFSPERVQLLLFTLWTAISYLADAGQNRRSGKLPEIPEATLAMLAGSHMIYLGGKAMAMIRMKNYKGGN